MDSILSHIAIVDVLFVLCIGYFLYVSTNVIATVLDLCSFVLTLLLSYKFYGAFARFFGAYFSIAPGIGKAIGFGIAWFFFETILFILARVVLSKIPDKVEHHPVNRYFAFIPAFLEGSLFFLLMVTTIFALPVKAGIKQEILSSNTGSFFIKLSQSMEGKVKNVFGDAIGETLNFLTVRQEHSEEVELGFKAPLFALSTDYSSEATMLELVNRERVANGAGVLEKDSALQEVARAYATEMMTNGFFSHESKVDGSTPAQRVERYGIEYEITGENLAYAPDVYIAHNGLMNSPGHRRNILAPEFGRVGIGVIDGGIYGRMFVQVFRN